MPVVLGTCECGRPTEVKQSGIMMTLSYSTILDSQSVTGNAEVPRGIPQCFQVNTFKEFTKASCQVIAAFFT